MQVKPSFVWSNFYYLQISRPPTFELWVWCQKLGLYGVYTYTLWTSVLNFCEVVRKSKHCFNRWKKTKYHVRVFLLSLMFEYLPNCNVCQGKGHTGGAWLISSQVITFSGCRFFKVCDVWWCYFYNQFALMIWHSKQLFMLTCTFKIREKHPRKNIK